MATSSAPKIGIKNRCNRAGKRKSAIFQPETETIIRANLWICTGIGLSLGNDNLGIGAETALEFALGKNRRYT